MKPAATATPRQHRLRYYAGFTLIEVIISLVIAGILASIAGMGIVSAISGYAVVKENVGLSQKIQLAATRINRELLELTAISDRDNTRPYIVYYSATGQRQTIAKVNDTIRLYDNPTEPISDTYLENNGDILTDSVDSFALNYFQGGNNWDGTDIRELSTIQFSLNLFRKDIAGSTVNCSTLVHLRNNDNYGGSAATLPVAPPTGDQYTCFISTTQSGPAGFGFTRTRKLIIAAFFLITLLCVVRCFNQKKSIIPAKAKNLFGNKDDGSALIGIIITIMVFAALGAAIVPMISSSQLHRTAASRSAQAYYLAESGLRYAASQYLNAVNEAAKNAALDNLHGVTHRLQGNHGEFIVSVNPYYFSVYVDPANTTTLVTRIYGELATGYSIPAAGGSLSIDATVYSFTSASIVGQQITFNMTASLTVPVDTLVYPVAQALAQTVSNDGDLSLSPGSGDMFPDRNGSFVLSGNTYTYRENNRDTNTLVGIKRTDGSDFSDFSLTANEDIRLKKFVKVTSNGAVGSGDMMASRDIVYYVQIPEKKEPQRIIFHEKFDDLNKWNESVFGAHEIVDLGGNSVLRVTGVTQSGVNTPSASLIPMNTGAVQFNPNHFDTQVKIGYLETPSPPTHGYAPWPIPKYYSAGLCFRLFVGGNTYGLSFQRGNASASPPDNIENDLIPVDDMHAIVLWQATNNGADKQWLAYSSISNIQLSPEINDTISGSDWNHESGKFYSSIPIPALPLIPCDFIKIKIQLSTTCTGLSCDSLEVSFDGEATWLPVDTSNTMEQDVSDDQGEPIVIAIRADDAPLPSPQLTVIINVVADEFDCENATLLARFKESASVTFNTGGPDLIEPGDRIIGNTSDASATVYGPSSLQSGNWAASDAAGTLLLENVNGAFQISERLSVPGKSELATLASFSAQDHFIKAYYGTESGCGIPNTDPLDGEKHPNPIDPVELNWPPDEGKPWTADRDYFRLIQWDAVNGVVGTVALVDSIDEPNTLIRSSEAVLMGIGSTLGLHTFGSGSLNIYFDDFGYQSFVDQPVAISQPIQY